MIGQSMSAASPPPIDAPPPEASGSERVNASDMPVAIGDILAGKYKVESVLGIGGMGIVVAARHIQLDQKVALKFLLPQAMQSPEAVERFQREARSAVRLRSEHVAKVTDVGVLETGAPYMVMEFLAGADLSHVVAATGAITIDEAVHFVLQACEAIAEAHSLGIIHRDLKPQNLFVTRRVDGKPLIKVLDFGISKTLDTQAGLSLTRTSSIMGSPLYMSPEQMRSSKNVDARSDIWGLGVILYELLTGRVPFEAEAIPELCLKVVQDPAEPPRSIRPDVPEGLSAVVLKCLEKDPAMRFENVADLAAALEPYTEVRGSADRIAGTLKIPSRPPMVSISGIGASTNPKAGTGGTAWGTTQRVLARKKRMPLIAGGVVAAVAVIGVAVFAFGHHSGQTSDEKTTASSSTVQAEVTNVRAPALTAPPTAFDMPVVAASSAPALVQATATRPAASGGRTTVKPAQTTSAKAVAPTVTAPPKNFE
jgi:serine/threonine protein kinase